ncbi:MAG: DUF5110 domain-containing protein [Oscillospiraceae bacterium]|nr:DUF5110 domain-containing protein [Oscillospiraceae bacterium]
MFTIGNEPVKVCLGAISENTLRVSILPVGESVAEVFSAIDLDERDWDMPSISLTGAEGASPYMIGCTGDNPDSGFFEVDIDGNDFSINISKDGRHVSTLSICETTGAIYFPSGNGELYGLGHGFARHFNRKGEIYDLQTNGQVRGIVENYSATSPTPLVISTEGWALFFHQPWRGVLDLRGDVCSFEKKPMEPIAYADIFVIDAINPEDAAKEYYRFSGIPPLPPKYAFGYQQSYRTLVHNDVNYVMKTARYMRDNDIPCDMLIYLGTGYCQYGWNVENGVFDWNRDSFPEPVDMTRELHDMNYKLCLHITKCHTGLHGKISDTAASPLDYDHAKNYWAKHAKLYAQAKNECWWPDDADEVDMRARLTRWRMYYEGSLSLNPDVRPFQMQRNTFPGANKWGGAIWSGDILSEWETLKNQVPIGLNASLSSTPYWGTDTGGFFSSNEFDGELFIRWFQFSTFTPFLRCHGRPSFLHNLWGWTMFGSPDEIPLEAAPGVPRSAAPAAGALPDDRVAPICKKYIQKRYELLPYIYNLAHETRSGIPIMRPMWYKYPGDETARGLGDQYLFGDSLIVAPITAKGAKKWDVYLPEGDYYCFRTGDKIKGGGYIEVDAALGDIPVYVPAGGLIAKTVPMQFVGTEKNGEFDPLIIEIYPGNDGSYALYEDDGISLGYLRDEYTITRFAWDDKKRVFSADGKSSMFPGRARDIIVKIISDSDEYILTVNY